MFSIRAFERARAVSLVHKLGFRNGARAERSAASGPALGPDASLLLDLPDRITGAEARLALDEPVFVKCSCDHCPGHLEFERSHTGTQVMCPHCGSETVLFAFGIPTDSSAPLRPLPQVELLLT